MTEWPIRNDWGERVIANGGKLTVENGGEVDIEAGGVFKIAGTQVIATAAQINALPPDGVQGVAANYALARGQHTTVAASDTVVTGLATVVAVVAQLDDDPVDGCMHVTSSIGNQAGAPAAGSIYLKTWKSTDADATLIAATTFGKKVNWIAIGTL